MRAKTGERTDEPSNRPRNKVIQQSSGVRLTTKSNTTASAHPIRHQADDRRAEERYNRTNVHPLSAASCALGIYFRRTRRLERGKSTYHISFSSLARSSDVGMRKGRELTPPEMSIVHEDEGK